MEDDLRECLEGRGIPVEIIVKLEEDKIDGETVSLMSDEQLAKYFPKFGDRVAVMDFGKRRKARKNTNRNSLLERLRKKIDIKRKCNDEDNLAAKRKPQEKSERIIELGWLHSEGMKPYSQVRTRNGGGTRCIKVSKQFKKNNLIEKAISLFFPNNKSTKGHLSDFNINLLDYKHHEIDSTLTVSQFFELTKLTKLRFYLATSRVCETITSEKSVLTETTTEMADAIIVINDASSPKSSFAENYDLNDFIKFDQTNCSTVATRVLNDDYMLAMELQSNEMQPEVDIVNDSLLFSQERSSIESKTTTLLKLHRGRILDELIENFTTIDLDCVLQIELISQDGKKEAGVDIGGVFRDCLSEFWTTFYERCTIGTNFKVPYLRHDFGETKWKSISKVLLKGWLCEGYFPVKIAPAFMEYCIFYKTLSNLQDSFLEFVSENEKDVLKSSLTSFDTIDQEELLDVLNNLECKWFPSKSNMQTLIEDISHKELIQKPKFVIDCFHETCKNMMSENQLKEVYKTSSPTVKNVLKLLRFEEATSPSRHTAANFLKKYVRESDETTRSNFLRYCTGANVVTAQLITVTFTNADGLLRFPVAHTCSSTLELPETYDSYPEFRSELNNILNSNVWIMDIV